MTHTAPHAGPPSAAGAPAAAATTAEGWTLVPLDDRVAWRAALEGIPHAFAHTWESCHAMQHTSGLPTQLVIHHGPGCRVVCPIARRTRDGHTDVVTPFGFSGFVGLGDCSDFPDQWEAFARSCGFVSGYIGLNPVLEQGAFHRPGDRHCHHELYVLDLRRTEQELFAGLSRNRQREIRGWETGPARVVHDQARLGAFFRAHLAEVLRERQAAGVYHLAPATLAALFEAENTFLVGAERDGRVETATMFAHTPYVGESLFNVSLPEGRRHSAVVTWHGALRLRALGVPLLNLGGGLRPGDGIARFKERFGARMLPLCALKQVYDRATYEALCRSAGVAPDDPSGYFPPYHAPRHVHQV